MAYNPIIWVPIALARGDYESDKKKWVKCVNVLTGQHGYRTWIKFGESHKVEIFVYERPALGSKKLDKAAILYRKRLILPNNYNFDTEDSVALPDNPTNALPGTLEKINIMAERFAAKRQLHHPDDKRTLYT